MGMLNKLDNTLERVVAQQAITQQESIVTVQPQVGSWTDIAVSRITRVDANSFTLDDAIPSSIFSIGTRLRIVQNSTTKYFVVYNVTDATESGTVKFSGGDDYTFTADTIETISYSNQLTPTGYPGSFSYSPNAYGIGPTAPTLLTSSAKFFINGQTLQIFDGLVDATFAVAQSTLLVDLPFVQSGVFFPSGGYQPLFVGGLSTTVNRAISFLGLPDRLTIDDIPAAAKVNWNTQYNTLLIID